MRQLKYGMFVLNVVVGTFMLAAGAYLFAAVPFGLAYLWSRYEV